MRVGFSVEWTSVYAKSTKNFMKRLIAYATLAVVSPIIRKHIKRHYRDISS